MEKLRYIKWETTGGSTIPMDEKHAETSRKEKAEKLIDLIKNNDKGFVCDSMFKCTGMEHLIKFHSHVYKSLLSMQIKYCPWCGRKI